MESLAEKVAIIDMGTNTFHLLLAARRENRFVILYRDKLAVKMGKGGINEDIIQPDALERAVRAMVVFNEKIKEEKIENVYAFATSALRNATNAAEVVLRIKETTNIDVNIISGDKEADFIYRGVRIAVPLGTTPALIIDIGGGSVEFIIGTESKSYWKRSFEIGGQRLLERFQKNDPIQQAEITALDNYFNEELKELFEALRQFNPITLVGSSGTFDTLSDIYCLRNNIHKTDDDPETPLTLESFYSIYDELIHKNREERMQIPGMIALRADMIVVACCLIRYILEQHPFTKVRVSSYALKEGVLDYLAHSEL